MKPPGNEIAAFAAIAESHDYPICGDVDERDLTEINADWRASRLERIAEAVLKRWNCRLIEVSLRHDQNTIIIRRDGDTQTRLSIESQL